MPEQLTQALQERIVDLRKAGRPYSYIQKETGVSQMSIAKVLKKAGLTAGRQPSSAPSPAASAAASTPPPAARLPSARPAPSPQTPVTSSGGDGLSEFQPAAPPAKPPQGRRVRVACCGAVIELEGKETEADLAAMACPNCGVA